MKFSPNHYYIACDADGAPSEVKEAVKSAFRYRRVNNKVISEKISTTTKDYLVNTQNLNGMGITTGLTLSTIIAISSVALGKPAI